MTSRTYTPHERTFLQWTQILAEQHCKSKYQQRDAKINDTKIARRPLENILLSTNSKNYDKLIFVVSDGAV